MELDSQSLSALEIAALSGGKLVPRGDLNPQVVADVDFEALAEVIGTPARETDANRLYCTNSRLAGVHVLSPTEL
jgi:hypothetical protein